MKRGVSDNVTGRTVGSPAKNSWSESIRMTCGPRSVGSSQDCHYCHERGHWKSECPVLRNRVHCSGSWRVKPAVCTVSVAEVPMITEGLLESAASEAEKYSGFGAFVSDGFVSLTASDKRVPVYSFILESLLPFSQDTDTGGCVLVRGIGLTTQCVPLHRASLSCDLVGGVVHLGECLALPLDGIDVILGNDLAGNRVWADGSPPVKPPHFVQEQDVGLKGLPDVFPACAVTCLTTGAALDPSVQVEDCDVNFALHMPNSFAISQQELIREQWADTALGGLFDQVQPSQEAKNTAFGYFLLDEERKWVPQVVWIEWGDPVVQIVVPTKYQN